MSLAKKIWGDDLALSVDAVSVCAGGMFRGTLTYRCAVRERRIEQIRAFLAFCEAGSQQVVAEVTVAEGVVLREDDVWTQPFELVVPDSAPPHSTAYVLHAQAHIDGTIDARAWKEVTITSAPRRAARWPSQCSRCGAPLAAPDPGRNSLRCGFCGAEHPVELEP